MPKQEYKIQSFHGGTNNKFDPRDIGDEENAYSQMSVSKPGRLVMEGSFKNLKSGSGIAHSVTDAATANGPQKGYGLHTFSHDYDMDSTPEENDTDFIVVNDGIGIDIYDPNNSSPGWNQKFDVGSRIATVKPSYYNVDGALRVCDSNFGVTSAGAVAALDVVTEGDFSGDADGDPWAVTTGWTYNVTNNDAEYSGSDDNATLTNTLTSPFIKAGKAYSLQFGVASATIDLTIEDGIGNTLVAKDTYSVATHTVTFTASAASPFLRFKGHSSGNAGHLSSISLKCTDAAIDNFENVISLDNASGGNITLNAGDIIKIDEELMYIQTTATSQSFTVIRGYANTEIKPHADNAVVYHSNIPKYFGHIKQDRLFEAEESNPVNKWVEDVQSPQPPNNTRSGHSVSPYITKSGRQSLRVFDSVSSPTSNFPSVSEKVSLEFGSNYPDVGIIETEYDADLVEGNMVVTTSAAHGFINGQTVTLNNLVSGIQGLSGPAEIKAIASTTKFHIDVEGAAAGAPTDTPAGYDLDYDDALYVSNISGWAKNTSYDNQITVTLSETNVPGMDGTTPIYIHITGVTSSLPHDYNGVKLATPISGGSNNDFRIESKYSDTTSISAITAAGAIQVLSGVVSDEGNAIDEDLKRKWNFAMSFTYDGPGQEVQESLLTQGYKMEEALTTADLIILLNGAVGSTTASTVTVDANHQIVVGDVIFVGSEQMKVVYVDTNVLHVIRGYNGSTASTQDDDAQVYILKKLTATDTVDWTNLSFSPSCIIKFLYKEGANTSQWNPRINGFKIYMKDVTDSSAGEEWRLFSSVNFNKGTYTIFASDDSEYILEQPGTYSSDYKISTLSSGTEIKIKPVDTYLSENLFTEDTIIDAQYKAVEVVGRRAYIGNIRQGGRTYPDRMLRTPVNRFDTFPETNYIDVAVGDGDSIVALKSFGDRLLQFKKDKVYVINVAGESEVLESEYNNAGITYPSQICKTMNGICWFNAAGLWLFDGKGVQNLTLQIEDTEYTITEGCVIGYDKNSDRVIYAPEMAAAGATKWYIYDLTLKSYTSNNQGLAPYSNSGINYFTNTQTDQDGNLIMGYISADTPQEFNVYQWSNTARGDELRQSDTYWKSKDIDLGSPGVRKKIYKVYVTYKSTGDSGANLEYATDGSGSFSEFSSTKSTNLTNGTFDDTAGGDGADPVWTVAELKPSSSINNIKSIQFRVARKYADGHTGGVDLEAVSTNELTLDTTSSFDFDEHNIGIYYGNGRYNVRRISAYNTTTKVATCVAGTDYGYGAVPDGNSKYYVGVTPADFEINDITVVFRMKRVK